jgi:hypothetical protein
VTDSVHFGVHFDMGWFRGCWSVCMMVLGGSLSVQTVLGQAGWIDSR